MVPQNQSPPASKRMSATQKMCATAGLFVAVSPVVGNAEIVAITDQPFAAQGNWDLDGTDGDDFSFRTRFSSYSTFSNANRETFLFFSSDGGYGTDLNGRLVVPDGQTHLILGLAPGFEVGATLPGGYAFGSGQIADRIIAGRLYQRRGPTSNPSSLFSTSYLGNNLVPGLNYVGFQFDQAGNTLFGWAEMDVDGFNVQITRWAYESTPGMSIRVGDTGVPEPGSLALLGLGAAGVLAMRRRRRDATDKA